MINETKNNRFQRLAKARGDLVVKYLRLLGNLSNTNNYEFTDEEVRKLFAVIEDELKSSKVRFNSKKKREITF